LDLEGKTREFKKALAEERALSGAKLCAVNADSSLTTPTKSATNTTTESTSSTLTPLSPPVHAFEASAEEEATVRVLADALPKIASATLVAKRHELLPLFARAATRHRVASVRVETLRHMFDLVKRPEPNHRDALAATAFAVARDAGEKRVVAELVPVLRSELAHKKQERRVAACDCVAAVARALPDTTRLKTCFPLLFDAFFACRAEEDASSEDASSSSSSSCPETRRASLRAFAAACDVSCSCPESAVAASAESFVAAALEDASEHVSECAAECAAPAMTRWRVRCAPAEANGADGGAEISPVAFLESFAKGRVGGAVAEALARNAEDGPTLPDRFRARFYLRLFARTLETFRDEEEALLRRETKVPENDERFKESVARWFASNASALIHTLVLSVPNGRRRRCDVAARRGARRRRRSASARAKPFQSQKSSRR
jgi:hypothetical protein